MKQYVIDELRPDDYAKLKAYLEENFQAAGIPGIYRIMLDEPMLNDIQKAHKDCRPFFFSIELEPDRISCEFLIRSLQIMRCNCIAYATTKQRDWMMASMDAIFEKLELTT